LPRNHPHSGHDTSSQHHCIESGFDVHRSLSKGAKAVQLDTALVREGSRVFSRLAQELRHVRGERT
jgi:dihydroorotate dehydrogenase